MAKRKTSQATRENNSKYWQQRTKQMYAAIEKDEAEVVRKLAAKNEAALSKLTEQIEAFYARYGEDNVIEYRELMKKLPAKELRLLIEKVDEFAKKHPELKHLIPVRENIYKLTRLEGLQVSLELQQLELGVVEEEEVRKHLEKQYKRAARETADALGSGKEFNAFDNSRMIHTLSERWVGGTNFSEKIWNNRKELADYLTHEFTEGVRRGDSLDKLRKGLEARYEGVSSSNIKRLVRTEGTFVASEAAAEVFANDPDYQYYRYSAVLDDRTSDICEELDGEMFRWEDREAGVNFPPMHPNCRSSFEVVIPRRESVLPQKGE